MSEIAVVGAGLVGPILALMLHAKGFSVEIYEAKKDPRNLESEGRSFDLALSKRGLDALEKVGLKETILNGNSVPVDSRLVHNVDGTTSVWPYGGSLHSIERKRLNRILLDAVERKGIEVHFEHRVVECKVHEGIIAYECCNERKEVKFDFIFGCDGAFSAVRRHGMMRDRETHMDYQQQYIKHGYKEIHVPETSYGDFAFEPKHLHLWPRKDFMLMGLPNPDKTTTLTLFMPFDIFEKLQDPDHVIRFFEKHFPDAIEKIGGREKLVEKYFSIKPGSMVSIKCHPHYAGRTLLLGDAAHAMVPFYGQGVNAGFQDCLVFCDYLNTNNDISLAAKQYEKSHWKNTHAIVELSLYNYDEMRDFMTNPYFWAKGKIFRTLNTVFPRQITPLYSMVAFNTQPYDVVIQDHIRQNNIITRTVITLAFTLVAILYHFTFGFSILSFILFIFMFYICITKLQYQWRYNHFAFL